MSKKCELIQELQNFKNAYEILEKNVKSKKENGIYTEIGLENEINGLLSSVEGSIQSTHDKLLTIVDKGLEALENKWRGATVSRLADGGYQAGLTNVIKMLEMEAITDQNDIRNIIAIYAGDYNALAMLKKTLLNSENEVMQSYAFEISKDYRNDTRRLLEKVRSNIDKSINIYAVAESVKGQNEGFSSLSFTLEGMISFVKDRLKDDLEVQEWQQS